MRQLPEDWLAAQEVQHTVDHCSAVVADIDPAVAASCIVHIAAVRDMGLVDPRVLTDQLSYSYLRIAH